MKKKYYVYKITNMINNKFYIGKRETTTEAETDTTYMGSGLLIGMSIKKYGIENFTKEIIHNCENREELNIQEKYWIKKLNSMDRNIGYNILPGGEGGDTFTNNPNKEEIRIKQQIVNIRPHTEETKLKISKSKKGVKFSDSHKQNLSLNHKGMKGMKHSEASLQKCRDAKKGCKLTPNRECNNCGRMIVGDFNLNRHYNKCIRDYSQKLI